MTSPRHYQARKMQSYLYNIKFNEALRNVYIADDAVEVEKNRIRQREHSIYMRGRLEGEQILSEQLVKQRTEMQTLQNGIFESLQKIFHNVASECERSLVELAIEVARKLVYGMEIDSQMVVKAITEAIERCGEESEYIVYINPEDYKLLENMNPQGFPIEWRDKIKLKPTEEVSRGGCVVQTRFGIIDNRRETKIRMIKESLQIKEE